VSRIAYLDCSSGASGDMLLGALVDLGLPVDALRGELAKLPLKGYRIEAHKVHRSGLHATKVDVVTEESGHGHGHGHEHAHDPEHGHSHGQPHRGLREILDLVDKSALEPAVKDRSARLFRRLAEAEAAVHGTSPEEVHFHEVGAVDSSVDIVGGVLGLTWLHADRVVASPLNLGTGTVNMSHGVFAVPPPATALLVTGHATAYGPLPPLRSEGVGHGAGSRDTPGRPNVLRLIVGEEAGASLGQKILVLEAEMDDLSPQLCGPLLEKLFAAGALDVYYTAIQMKKGRPGILVTVLVEPDRREAAEEVLFAEATTLGVRRQEWERTVLDREIVTVETPYGPVGVKVGRRGGRIYNAQPEFDDCQRAAAVRGVAVKEVWAAAVAAYRTRHPSPS